jgi:serine/threonine-protein kinase
MPPNRYPTARVPSAPPPYAALPRSSPPRGMSPTAGIPVGPSRVSASPFPEPKTSSGKPVLIALISLLVVGLGAAVAILMLPKTGTLVVTVAGPGNKPVDAFQVLLNGRERCRSSPCRIAELEPGTHLIRVTAPGYQATAEQAIKVESGNDAVVHLALSPASEGTGIAVTAEGSGLTLSVDGREVGLLPQSIKDMTPGEHVVTIVDKNQRFKPFEQRVTVETDKILKLEPRLKVAKGLAVIHAGDNASDARVLLVSGNERRPIPNLPIKIDIATDKPYSLLATKKGFQDYQQDITFEDGQAEKTFVVALTAEPGAQKETPSEAAEPPAPRPEPRAAPRAEPRPEPAPRVARTRPAPAPAPRRAPASEAEPSPAAGASSIDAIANGTLNLISSPPSTVVLDGKPLGLTPKTGISVSPGPHTLLFVHPEHGRKSRTITVSPGKTATATVSFP